MVSDSGSRLTDKSLAGEGNMVVEIELQDPSNNDKAWVYLVYFPMGTEQPEFKPKVFLEPDKKEFVAHGSTWMFKGALIDVHGKTYRTVLPNAFFSPSNSGGTGENFLDRLKARAHASLLFGSINFSYNEAAPWTN